MTAISSKKPVSSTTKPATSSTSKTATTSTANAATTAAKTTTVSQAAKETDGFDKNQNIDPEVAKNISQNSTATTTQTNANPKKGLQNPSTDVGSSQTAASAKSQEAQKLDPVAHQKTMDAQYD